MWRWRKRTDEDFSEEIQTNITLDMDRLEAEGMSPEDAKTAALRAFGNITRAKERFHESQWPIWLQQVAQDLRYAGRILRKDPLFSLVAIASLAVVIWLNTSVFTIVNALLFRPLPVERADRLADVYTSGIAGDAFQPSSYPDYLDFRSRNEVFTDILGFTPTFAAIRGRDQSRLALGEAVTGNYFGLLGVKAAL